MQANETHSQAINPQALLRRARTVLCMRDVVSPAGYRAVESLDAPDWLPSGSHVAGRDGGSTPSGFARAA